MRKLIRLGTAICLLTAASGAGLGPLPEITETRAAARTPATVASHICGTLCRCRWQIAAWRGAGLAADAMRRADPMMDARARRRAMQRAEAWLARE